MTDIVDRATRSKIMATVRGANTKPELALRRVLHARGLRYRLHAKALVGKPDLVLPRFKAVVFVHGCFWHRHFDCRYATMPATRTEFWQAKFDANVSRDAAVKTALLKAGWRVATIWECALRKSPSVATVADRLIRWLASDSNEIDIGEGNR